MSRTIPMDKKQALQIAKQAGAAYDFAASKGHIAVTERKPATQAYREHRNNIKRIARKSRAKNRA